MKTKSLLILTCLLISFSGKISAQGTCFSGNCQTGIGTMDWDSGDTYTGEFIGGSRTGYGEYIWKNGSFYFGHFVSNKLDGRGYYQSNEGKVMSGTFKDGVLDYSQTISLNDNCIAGDCQNGIGCYFWSTGDSYVGEWVNGNRTGYGRYDWKGGGYYIGHLKNNKLDGTGYYKSGDGSVMNGSFTDGVFNGTSTKSSDTQAAQPAEEKKDDTYDWLAKDEENDKKIEAYHPQEVDFCTMLKTVVAEFPGNFVSLQGLKDEGAFSFGEDFISNKMVAGAPEKAKVVGGLLTDNNTWYNTIYKNESLTTVEAKYHEYVEQINNCKTLCCSMIYDDKKYNNDSYLIDLAMWMVYNVQDGYSSTYKEMEIDLEVNKDIIDKGYYILLRVKHKD